MSALIEPVTVPQGERGDWRVEKFHVEAMSIANLRLAREGRACSPGVYTRLVHKRRGIIMSDTTAERRDHWSFILAAEGHVLINGLGLGMCLAAALARPKVIKATVIEIDQDVIDLVWPTYAARPNVEIIQDDAFAYRPPSGIRYGAVWHDIWDEICENNRPQMTKLHRKYGRLADWQGSWGMDRMNLERQRDRRHRRLW